MNRKNQFFIIVVMIFLSQQGIAQRPLTDSIIRLINSEMYRGNYDKALAQIDLGYKYSLIEEPENRDKWNLFFKYKKIRLVTVYKSDLEKAEELINQVDLNKIYSNQEAQYFADQIINVKADINKELGDYEYAKDLYLLVYKKNPDDFLYKKKYLNRMNSLFSKKDELDSAFYYSEKLINLLVSQGDTTNGFYFGSIMQHAIINAGIGNSEESERLVNQIRNNYGGFFTKSNYGIRMGLLYQMAHAKALTGDYKRAYQLAKDSESIFLKLRGKQDYEYSKFLVGLGGYQYYLNDKDSTYFYFANIPSKFSLYTKQRTDFLSIRGKEIFMNKNNSIREKMLFILDYLDNEYIEYNSSTYDYLLYQKSNMSQSIDDLRAYFQRDSQSSDQEEFVSWQENRSDYYKWLTKHEVDEDSSKILANLLEIQEKELFRKAGLSSKNIVRTTTYKEVLDGLSDNEAAVEFVRYKDIKSKEIFYGALVVSQHKNHPIFVKLCKEVELQKSIEYNFAETDFEYTERVYRSGTLYNLIWKPLEPHMKNTKKCYASLSGLLYKIALDATFSDNTSLHPKIQLLHSTASVVNKAPSLPVSPVVSLYGGVKYNLAQVEKNDSLSGIVSENVHYLHRGTESQNWNYLKGTEKEVIEIKDILQKKGFEVQLNLGINCSENKLKERLTHASPNILHIATHGYYPLAQDSVLSYTQTATYARSGLVMAGANTSKKENAPIEKFGDGILTAPEITALNLSNTQLVVLSACETGKGQVSHVDEIYGLQRAFKITGAKYVIYTLWKIPDESSKDFMVHFYKTLSEGNSIESSFFKTKEVMKKKYPVYHWAGFQLIR